MCGLTCRVGAHNSRYAHDTRLYPIYMGEIVSWTPGSYSTKRVVGPYVGPRLVVCISLHVCIKLRRLHDLL